MSLKLGSLAPDFEAESTHGTLRFHEWAGDSWVVFFSHPADYAPVCTTELGAVARLLPEFERRRCKVLALSVDELDAHEGFVPDVEATQEVKVGFPIVADPSSEVARAYAMIHPAMSTKLTARSVLVIDPDKKVRATLAYPLTTGRNFVEVLRLLDGIQITEAHPVATPAQWESGDDVLIVPYLRDPEELKARFPGGFTELTPYLRFAPAPTKDD
ncbi:MAG: peroxiredoxin [Myxococcota bacterium]